MIKAGKYYLCTETVGNISPPQLRYYFDGTLGFHSESNNPCIIEGRIYEACSDGFIIDSIGQRIKVCRKTERCLRLIPFELTDKSKKRIELYSSRGINVSVQPSIISIFPHIGTISTISPRDPANPTIGVRVELSTNFDKYHFFAMGIGSGETQEEAFTFAWKNLRVSTPFIKRIKRSLAGYRRRLYREFINYERIC
jgi:hypothetical protein